MASIPKIANTVISCIDNNKKLISKTSDVTSSAAAYGVSRIARVASSLPNEVLCRIDIKVSDKFQSNPEYSKAANNIVDAVLEKTNLTEKGVKIYDINMKNINAFEACSLENSELLEQVAKGENAFFNPENINLMNGKVLEANSVIINREKMAPTLLHELGHADNYNNSAFLRFISKIAYTTSAMSEKMPILAVLTKNCTSKNGSILQKTQSALHNLSPLFSGIFALPTLIDEAMASKKAIKWAKEFGDEKFTKELTKNLTSAYSTYLSTFFSNVTTTGAAKISKDKILQKIEERL